MGTSMSMWRALNAALHDEFAADPRVILIGEDVTTWGAGGGIYGVTRKMRDTFGDRVRDTPISEEVMVAAATGAAMGGTPTVLEIMYSDFILLGADGLINQAAKSRYMFGGQFNVPLTIRTNGGAGGGKAAQHSQSMETLFAHIPGLEVVLPSTPNDAYGLLRTAIRSDNPTLFLEHKSLYFDKGPVEREPIPFGVARRVREGQHCTVVATQWMIERALAAAEALSETGIELEVIDPRTLYPLDLETITASVERTGRLLVVHEAPLLYGWGGEVVSTVVAECFDSLLAPPRRLGGARTPVPYAEPLEQAVAPSVEQIRAGVIAMLDPGMSLTTAAS